VDLDDELRRLFQDQRLDIPVKAGADDAVVTGARRVRRNRRMLASAGSAFAVAALVAGGIALAGLGSPTSLPPASTSTATTTESSVPVSGSVGFGVLKLGMAEADAVATGFLDRGPDDGLGCHTYFTQGHPDLVGAVVVSPTAGIVRITIPDTAQTSMGIGVGSTTTDLKARYPRAVERDSGFTVAMGGTPSWYYVFTIGADKVTVIRMQLDAPECLLD